MYRTGGSAADELEIFETLPEGFVWIVCLDILILLELRGTYQAYLRVVCVCHDESVHESTGFRGRLGVASGMSAPVG